MYSVNFIAPLFKYSIIIIIQYTVSVRVKNKMKKYFIFIIVIIIIIICNCKHMQADSNQLPSECMSRMLPLRKCERLEYYVESGL